MNATGQRLAPCPFCGSRVLQVVEVDIGTAAVVCDQCGGTGPTGDGHLDATMRWNARPQVGESPQFAVN